MNTAANTRKTDAGRFYTPAGEVVFEVPKKTGGGMRKPTIADARENGWFPSVTTLIRVLDKPALNAWLTEQSVLAALTTPRKKDEPLDRFIQRVLHEERVQDQEAAEAADKGSAIHDAIALALKGEPFDDQWKPYVQAVFPVIETMGKVRWVEKVLVGNGYAGRADALMENNANLILLDWKTTKKLPKDDSWTEHKIQTSLYCAALGNTNDKHVISGNLYLSTVQPGQIALFLQENWRETYERAGVPLIKLWQYLNNYYPGGQV